MKYDMEQMDLRKAFRQEPESCHQALMKAAYACEAKERRMAFRPSFAMALLLTLAITVAAGAAFYPQIIGWFADQYGEKWGAWLEQGSVAAPQISMEAEGAVFTVEEVLVRGRGLYVLGTIHPQNGYQISDYDMPAKPEAGKNLRYVNIGLEKIGVDGGAMLSPSTWGYAVEEKENGSLMFSIEAEDGMAIEPGAEYTLEMYAHSYGANDDGSLDPEDCDTLTWTFSVEPKALTE